MIVSNLEKYVFSCQQTHRMADGSVVLLGTDVKLFDLFFWAFPNAEDQQILWEEHKY